MTSNQLQIKIEDIYDELHLPIYNEIDENFAPNYNGSVGRECNTSSFLVVDGACKRTVSNTFETQKHNIVVFPAGDMQSKLHRDVSVALPAENSHYKLSNTAEKTSVSENLPLATTSPKLYRSFWYV